MKKYGLIGYPLGHSFSRSFFNEKFESEGIDAEYVNFEIPAIDDFPKVIDEHPDIQGLNVTIPYKEKVIPLLDDLNEDAREIGAVNVIKFVRQPKKQLRLVGYNSDFIGFMQSIQPILEPHHRKALLLGTGGASKAIHYALRKMNIECRFVSRRKKEHVLAYDELTEELMQAYKIIVNCTPVGMFPHTDECPEIPYRFLTPRHLLYDLLYNPDLTLFLKKGAEKGAVVKNGLEMLLFQAFAAWDIWNK